MSMVASTLAASAVTSPDLLIHELMTASMLMLPVFAGSTPRAAPVALSLISSRLSNDAVASKFSTATTSGLPPAADSSVYVASTSLSTSWALMPAGMPPEEAFAGAAAAGAGLESD
jgi:hypothetical protein